MKMCLNIDLSQNNIPLYLIQLGNQDCSMFMKSLSILASFSHI